MTADPGKEHGTNKPPPTGRVQERSKGDQSWVFIGRTDVVAETHSSSWWWLISSVFLPGPPVVKQFMQIVTMVPGQGGWFQSVCFP